MYMKNGIIIKSKNINRNINNSDFIDNFNNLFCTHLLKKQKKTSEKIIQKNRRKSLEKVNKYIYRKFSNNKME